MNATPRTPRQTEGASPVEYGLAAHSVSVKRYPLATPQPAEPAAAPQSGTSDTDERLWCEARHAVEKLRQADAFMPPSSFGALDERSIAFRFEKDAQRLGDVLGRVTGGGQ